MKDEIISLYLTRLIYSTFNNFKDNICITHFKEKTFLKCVEFIDETDFILNGLQAAAYLDSSDKLYLVIRGADVGIGKKLFKIFDAKESYIPLSNGEAAIKTTFQDWIYSSIIAAMGLGKFYQYNSVSAFFEKIIKKYPNKKIIVTGFSLGGLLAQKLFITHSGIYKCITFSAISPWWTFDRKSQKILKGNDFYNNCEKIKNYYSHHDFFRCFPFFSQKIGKHYNVQLHNYKSSSNLLASLLERICWGHIPNYYKFDKNRDIIKIEDSSLYQRLILFLRGRCKVNYWINMAIITIILLLTSLVNFIVANMLEISLINHVLQGKTVLLFCILNLLFIPTFLSRSNWKYFLLCLNILSLFIFPIWIFLFIISFLSNECLNDE